MEVSRETEVFSTGTKPSADVMRAETIKVLQKAIENVQNENFSPLGVQILIPYEVPQDGCFGVMESAFGNRAQLLEMLQKVTIGKIEQELGIETPVERFDFSAMVDGIAGAAIDPSEPN